MSTTVQISSNQENAQKRTGNSPKPQPTAPRKTQLVTAQPVKLVVVSAGLQKPSSKNSRPGSEPHSALSDVEKRPLRNHDP